MATKSTPPEPATTTDYTIWPNPRVGDVHITVTQRKDGDWIGILSPDRDEYHDGDLQDVATVCKAASKLIAELRGKK